MRACVRACMTCLALVLLSFAASDTDLKVIDDLMQRFRKALPLYQDSGRDGNISKTPFKHLDPRDMLLFSVSGSKLYNLHLPTSDEDFVCAYQYKNPRVRAYL